MRRTLMSKVVPTRCVSLYHALELTFIQLFLDVQKVSVVSLLAEDYSVCVSDGDPEYGGLSPIVRAAFKGWTSSIKILLECPIPFREGTLRRALV